MKDGKVDRIYIVSEGENYPVGDQGEVVVTDVTVINLASGYKDGDKVIDNIGNEYDVTIRNGFILKVKPLTQLAVDDFHYWRQQVEVVPCLLQLLMQDLNIRVKLSK